MIKRNLVKEIIDIANIKARDTFTDSMKEALIKFYIAVHLNKECRTKYGN